ncbi:MAG: hypothetical protein QE271_05225 [Bacteriovoracaceae bacterium]|nr:hypothetical protein [Bacteriovoracaceae bacterium]
MKISFFISLIFQITFYPAHSFELNYRLLERKDIQNNMHNQFTSIEKNFFELLGMLTSPVVFKEQNNLLNSYYLFQKSLPEFRTQCVNPLVSIGKEESNACQQAISVVIKSIRLLDESLQNLLLLNPAIQASDPTAFLNYELSPMAMNLNFSLSTELHRYEIFLHEMSYGADIDPENTRWIGLEQFNGLKNLAKQLQSAILAGSLSFMRDDLTLFWQQYIDIMIEKSSPQEKREYWMINLFQLNLRINEFFYSCERHKQRMTKNSYNLCEEIHNAWNQNLKRTLQFKKSDFK